jgi:hypothetical protein
MANKNNTLHNAKTQKADEFYTQLSDIEKELSKYKEQFKTKVIFCNCDDPEYSNFYYYFVSNFDELKLKKLITTHFEIDKASYKLEYSGGADVQGDKESVIRRAIKVGAKTKLKQNFEQGSQSNLFEAEPMRSFSGDFRSPECIELLKESDIVVTNPPFSLFREYVAQLIEYGKKFLILGDQNAITYKETFSFIKANKMWLGYDNGGTKWFQVPMDYEIKTETRIKIENNIKYFSMGRIMWFTNLETTKRHEDLTLYKKYYGNENEFPKYDNYDAININKVADIPLDYEGVMGVPLTFIDKYNPEQFEIVGITNHTEEMAGIKVLTDKTAPFIMGKGVYVRILIRNLKPTLKEKE